MRLRDRNCSYEDSNSPVVAGVSPASFWLGSRHGCHYRWPGSSIPATTTKSHPAWGAHAPSRAGDGALAIANFPRLEGCSAKAPNYAREARALPNQHCLPIIAVVLCSVIGTQAQEPTPTPQSASEPVATTFEVIVTGSNIPTAEEVGPQPVDIYRKIDIERLGAQSATDFVQKLPIINGIAINENL